MRPRVFGRLARYVALQSAFESHGFGELFADPGLLDGFLATHRQAGPLERRAEAGSRCIAAFPAWAGLDVASSGPFKETGD